MNQQTTFRTRLTVQTTLLCLLVLAVAGTAVFLGARAALLANLDGALLEVARAELASALDGPGGKVHVHEETSLVLRGASGYEKYALIRDEQGEPAAFTANLRRSQLDALDSHTPSLREGAAIYNDVVFYGQRLRAIHYPFQDLRGVAYTATCAVPYAPMDQALRLLSTILLLSLTACALGAMWGAWRLAIRLTKPLAELAERARHIREDSLHERIPLLSQDKELSSLTEGLNAMLLRLDTTFTERQRMIEAQRQFLMDASHELRTPVSNLRGTLEVALRRPRSAESYRETLELCLPETARLSVLVNDLLILARAEAGSIVLTREPLDFVALVAQALQTHQARAAEQKVTLAYAPAESVALLGDPVRLRQVLDNLLDNAFRFAPPETALEVQVYQQDSEAILTIRDHGPGIPPEDIPHLFERFWRADASRTRATGGLGLGLAITRSLVEAHGGSIRAASAPGEGATFTVRLPSQHRLH